MLRLLFYLKIFTRSRTSHPSSIRAAYCSR